MLEVKYITYVYTYIHIYTSISIEIYNNNIDGLEQNKYLDHYPQ